MDAVTWEDRGATRWILLRGELDTEGYLRVCGRFHSAVDEAHEGVVIDLDGVRFLSSDGIRLLLEARNRQRDRGRALHLNGLSPTIRRLLRLTGVLAAIPEWPAESAGASPRPG